MGKGFGSRFQSIKMQPSGAFVLEVRRSIRDSIVSMRDRMFLDRLLRPHAVPFASTVAVRQLDKSMCRLFQFKQYRSAKQLVHDMRQGG